MAVRPLLGNFEQMKASYLLGAVSLLVRYLKH